MWLGQRAMWLAAGWVFGRLLASRLSLLIHQMEYFAGALAATGIGEWMEELVRRIGE